MLGGLRPQDPLQTPAAAPPAGESLARFSSSESAKTSASSWSDMSVNSVRSRRSKCTSREEMLLRGSAGRGACQRGQVKASAVGTRRG